ncbi:MAG: hypothetical protein RBS07_02150 [Lentimicrobium sp.]|nr:hypothetical protein [Lentimicrobium sp.]
MDSNPNFGSLSAFLKAFDKPGNIVLLEGKRKVNAWDEDKLSQLGRLLANRSTFIKFRSGNATGADELFSRGVADIDPSRLEVIKPYASHRSSVKTGATAYSMDEIDLAEEPEVVYHSRQNQRMAGLIDKFILQIHNRLTAKAAYILRDTVKVCGTRSGIAPATVAFFYDNLSNPMQGGTGHTMQVCTERKVPFCDQQIWMNWIGEDA